MTAIDPPAASPLPPGPLPFPPAPPSLPAGALSLTPGPQSLPAGALYDARRRLYYAKPALRGWLHLLWFGASLLAGPLLVIRGHGAWPVTGLVVYAVSVSGLFGISALYHRGTWSPAWSARLQRLDHMMIFFLIAGTATPAFVLAMPGVYGLSCLIVMWALILAAACIHFAWMGAPETLVGVTFIALGSLAGVALPEVWIHAGAVPGALMLTGGIIYIAGAVSYHRRKPDPSPAVFGYHEVFHACVCAAATCQYLSITLITARIPG